MAKAQAAAAATQTSSGADTAANVRDTEGTTATPSAAAGSLPFRTPESANATQEEATTNRLAVGPEEIRLRAYMLWEERGCPIGEAELDWLRAEAELLGNESSGG